MEIGLSGDLLVREERLSLRQDACRVLYVSDIHLRRSRSENLCRQVLAAVDRSAPDVVLLGGDMIDTPSELGKLCELVTRLRESAPVLAIGGNHDSHVGIAAVQDAVERGGGQWIHDGTFRLLNHSRWIAISGPGATGQPESDIRILCGHHPRIWKTARHSGFDLVLAGHLHGCQIVAFEFSGCLFPGAVFYPYCCLRQQSGSARLVVSRGVSDLVPIRWCCPREVVLCHV